jgi:ribonuclease BN (tRNA processing enzyme)
MGVRVRLLGTGDAFGTAGRLQTCFLVEHDAGSLLVDCGASALSALRREGIEPNALDGVVLSHLHGDHFGGLPVLLLDAHHASRRERPLVIAGPRGTPARLEALFQATYPGSWDGGFRFDLQLPELEPGRTEEIAGVRVLALEVRHPSGAPSLGLRVEVQGRVFAFSGDTEWVPALADLARGADLLVIECYAWEPGVRYHLDDATLREHRHELEARRVVVTHLGPAAQARRDDLAFEVAEDGMRIEL